MESIVKVKSIKVSFKCKQVLQGIDCELFQGEVVGLVGPNGSGKTTLMKALLGFIKIESGTILKNDKRLTGLIEQPGLYPFMTGLEHLEMFNQVAAANDQIDILIDLLDLSKFINKKTKEYSLGMKQRLGIAISLLNDPDVVVLDEPMNGLDPYSIKLLRELILTYCEQGTTFLVSSHLLNELEQIADRVLLLKEGKLIWTGEQLERLNDFEEELIAKLI